MEIGETGGMFTRPFHTAPRQVADAVSARPLASPSGGATVARTANVGGSAWGTVGTSRKATPVDVQEYTAWFGRGERLDRYAGHALGLATGKVAKGMAATAAIGITGYAGYAKLQGQVNQHQQVAASMNKMRNSLKYGGRNRAQDFEHNPMMNFSRPRVRGGHMGANGGLTLALNNRRTRA
jgi:hypothetical protein